PARRAQNTRAGGDVMRAPGDNPGSARPESTAERKALDSCFSSGKESANAPASRRSFIAAPGCSAPSSARGRGARTRVDGAGVRPKARASKGRGLVGPAASADRGLADLTDLSRFAGTLSPGTGTLTKEPVRALGGQRAVSVRSATGARLWVADTGAARPLRVERTGAESGFVNFGDYDAPLEVR